MRWIDTVRWLLIVVVGAAFGVMIAAGVHTGGLGTDPAWLFDCNDTTCTDLWATARHHYHGVAVIAGAVAFAAWLAFGRALPVRTDRAAVPSRRPFGLVLLQSGASLVVLMGGAVVLSYVVFVSRPLMLAGVGLVAGALALMHWIPLRRETGRDRAAWFASMAAVAATFIAGVVVMVVLFPVLFILAPYAAVPVMVVVGAVARWALPAILLPTEGRNTDGGNAVEDGSKDRRCTHWLPGFVGSAGVLVIAILSVAASLPVPAPPADAATRLGDDLVPPTPPPHTAPTLAAPNAAVPPPASTNAPPGAHLSPIGLPACLPGDLRVIVNGWSYAMGNSMARLVATNTGDASCALVGRPLIHLAQGGTGLHLKNQHLPPYREPDPPPPEDGLGVAPGDSASATLYWPGYRNAADQSTPEAVTIQLTGAGQSARATIVDGEFGDPGPAPFDLIDKAVIQVGRWKVSNP